MTDPIDNKLKFKQFREGWIVNHISIFSHVVCVDSRLSI